MSRRAVSPAASEPEMDIFGSIYPGDDAGGKKNGAGDMDADFDFDGLMNGQGQGDEDDGDEAFIALKQAASFRKSSNLKGRTVKKGGGFQAMGKNVRSMPRCPEC